MLESIASRRRCSVCVGLRRQRGQQRGWKINNGREKCQIGKLKNIKAYQIFNGKKGKNPLKPTCFSSPACSSSSSFSA